MITPAALRLTALRLQTPSRVRFDATSVAEQSHSVVGPDSMTSVR